jgi:hypothetical protein
MMAATSLKVIEMDEENNLMWEEIKEMSVVIGDKNTLKNVSTNERQSFFTEDAKTRLAEGKHSPPRYLSTTRKYTGPEIKP